MALPGSRISRVSNTHNDDIAPLARMEHEENIGIAQSERLSLHLE